MRQALPSGSKVQYDLRPAKQAERRMIIEGLLCLTDANIDISGYHYTGMGSWYFVDFIMFHRYLGIGRMLSVEKYPEYQNRVNFNRPYKFIDIKIGDIGDVLPDLSRDILHFVWLDYDFRLNESTLEDVAAAFSTLPRDSIVLVTIDVEPPVNDDHEEFQQRCYEYYRKECGKYFPPGMSPDAFKGDALPLINKKLICDAINEGMSPRQELDFLQLFNFVYADGHEMITLGGIIGDSNLRERIGRSRLSRKAYYRDDAARSPFRIVVPKVTRKERAYLDYHMPCANDWLPSEFELTPDEVLAYREVYAYLPSYAELLSQ